MRIEQALVELWSHLDPESSLMIAISVKNIVESHGGVMITYKDSFSISNTTFTDNGASSFSGVMEIYGESSFNIVNSVFAHNSVVLNGGVMRTFGEVSLNITSCMFRSNKAGLYGGVIGSVTSKGSSFYIRNSTFTKTELIMVELRTYNISVSSLLS